MSQRFVWRHTDRPALQIINTISSALHALEWKTPNAFTDVRRGNQLLVVSDYSGDHNTSKYQAISFIIADTLHLGLWNKFRDDFRKLRLSTRRFSYKDLNDKRKLRYLPCFLNCADNICGNLVTFLIDKKIKHLFGLTRQDFYPLRINQKTVWKEKPFEKLLRTSIFISLCLDGLSRKGQNVLWVTDNDEILPSPAYYKKFIKFYTQISGHILTHCLGKYQFATTKIGANDLLFEDLISIPDLACGALCDIFSNLNHKISTNLATKASPRTMKTRHMLHWLSFQENSLKKIICRLDCDKEHISINIVDLFNNNPPLMPISK